MVCRNQLLFCIFVSCLCFSQQTITFESSPDSQVLTTQIPGLTFTNAKAIHAGITLNEIDFPAKSGTVAAVDRRGPISIDFDRPAGSFSAFLTHTKRVTLSAYDPTGKLLGTTASPTNRNSAPSPDPGATHNELIEIRADRIARIVLAADPGGSSFVIDDIAFADYIEKPTFSVSPERVTFEYALTLPPPPPERIFIDAEPNANYTSESTARWVRVSPATGPAGGRVLIAFDVSQLPAPGNHQATVTFRSGGAARTVVVILRLAAAPVLYGTPSELTFAVTRGGPRPPPQAILVGSRNVNQLFSATASTG